MRFYYVALVAASALYISTDGLETVPSSAVSTSLRGATNSMQLSNVEDRTNRFLIAEDDILNNDDLSQERSLFKMKKKKKKKKKKKEEEEGPGFDSDNSGSSSNSDDSAKSDKYHHFFSGLKNRFPFSL